MEEYKETKITRVVVAAGLSESQAKSLTSAITKWLNEEAFSKLPSLKLRDKVIEELKKINKDAFNLFSWYQNTKEQPE